MKRSYISLWQCDKVKTLSAMDQSYSNNRSDTIVMSIGPLDILPCSVCRSDYFGNLCYKDNTVSIITLISIAKSTTVNLFNFAAIKFCVLKDSKFHRFKNLSFSNFTHML